MNSITEHNSTGWGALEGHASARALLSQALSKHTVPHAMMFIGPSGVGKRTAARAFAAQLFHAMSPLNESPTGEAQTARLLAEGSHPDLHLVGRSEERKYIAVEDIRELCGAVRLRPYYGGGHVAILDDAHEMNSAAYNALLMTLEEPPPNCYLILITDSPQRLPATIISRCQPVHFGELSERELRIVLSKLVAGFDESQLTALTRFAGGSLEALDLSGLIDPLTLRPLDSAALEEHLAGISNESVRIGSKIRELLNSEPGRDPAYVAACILAQELGGNKDSSVLVWRLILQELRHALRSSNRAVANRLEPNRSGWADLLEMTIQSLAMTKERNLNLPLQLTNIFAKAAEIAVR